MAYTLPESFHKISRRHEVFVSWKIPSAQDFRQHKKSNKHETFCNAKVPHHKHEFHTTANHQTINQRPTILYSSCNKITSTPHNIYHLNSSNFKQLLYSIQPHQHHKLRQNLHAYVTRLINSQQIYTTPKHSILP